MFDGSLRDQRGADNENSGEGEWFLSRRDGAIVAIRLALVIVIGLFDAQWTKRQAGSLSYIAFRSADALSLFSS
jgi:hypothetical protein